MYRGFELAQGRDDLSVWRDIFQYFEGDALRRKLASQVAHEKVAVDVDEGARAADQVVEPDLHERIHDDSGAALVAAWGGDQFARVHGAKQQLVGVHPKPLVKDGLASDQCRRRRRWHRVQCRRGRWTQVRSLPRENSHRAPRGRRSAS